jgi:hypothetical protein
MKAFACGSCDAKIKALVSFCPSCGEPTHLATPDELREWDLGKWRASREKQAAVAHASVSAVASPNGRVSATLPAGGQYTPQPPATEHRPTRERHSPARTATNRRTASVPRTRRSPGTATAKHKNGLLARVRVRRDEARAHTAELDRNDPFIYFACTHCERTDWLLRTGRNEDGTWRYWCVRCSKSFKSDAWIDHGRKPFVVSGVIFATLITLTSLV